MKNAPAQELLVQALRSPDTLPALPAVAWDQLVRQARRADLLSRIAFLLEERGLTDAVAAAPRAHLHAARIHAEAQHAEVRREVAHITQALAAVGVQTVLLKGAAYLMGGYAASLGRLFADVDILVPKAVLPQVEASLMLHGWASTHHNAYDQRYYRQWMHELPPMRHIKRQTVLDVHHAILPETARLHPDSALLLAGSCALEGQPVLRVLAPPDMVLHSMTHLFHNEEMSHGLRDLSDLDRLLRQFGAQAGFWEQLAERARELGLQRPLHYGLRHTAQILGTPVPPQVRGSAPAAALVPLMDMLWSRALRSQHPTAAAPFTRAALFSLYVRAHWLRMPPGLLTRHLLTKALRSPDADRRPR